MNILDEIIAHKKKEVAEAKRTLPVHALEKSDLFASPTFSLREFVQRPDKTGIIAEFKRKSPSKGMINANASVESTTKGYVAAGASALSVLSDEKFFGGSNNDVKAARRFNQCPILRKEFMVDEYQFIEAKSIGADAILLIAAVLDPKQVKEFTRLAHSLKLEVLLEVHNQEELRNNIDSGADLIGVNNRDLKTFEVSLDTSKRLSEFIPSGTARVAESGITTPEDIIELRKFGYEGFLIGENFMKHEKPEEAARDFTRRLTGIKV